MPNNSFNCVYIMCKNNRIANKELTFFSFPWKNQARCKIWVINCGNSLLFNVEPTALRNKLICEKHFRPEFIMHSRKRKLLSASAVPLKFNCELKVASKSEETDVSPVMLDPNSSEGSIKVLESRQDIITYPGTSKEYAESDPSNFLTLIDNTLINIRATNKEQASTSGSSSVDRNTNALINMPSPIPSADSPRKIKLKKKIIRLNYKLKKKSDINLRLRQKALSFSTRNVLTSLLKNKSPAAKTLIFMQCFHTKRSMWTSGEKQLALSLYYKSPGNYKFMLKTLKFVLPGISTIQSWLKIFNLKTGLNTKLMEKFKLKVSNMEADERLCVLMFDEITLKKGLDHNKFHDVVEGYEDFGDHGRFAKFVKTALVFYVRGLLYNWKMPCCYYLSSGPVKGTIVSKLMVEVTEKMQQLGLLVRMAVCDQGANNRSALSLLGATAETPKITVGEQTILVCFDVPHLLKSLRNNFMNKKLTIFVDGKLISWNDFEEAYKIDKSSKVTRSMLKITDKHVYPTNFQKMRVKYAAQVFSHSVSSTIYTLMATGQLQTITAANTAAFLKQINNIFDCLNSRVVLDSNPFKSSLSVFKILPYQTLTAARTYFNSIKVFEKSVQRNNIHCIDGFSWTLNAILILWDKLKEEGQKYLLTSRLNQDPLENLFSVLRNRGGYNPQPTSKEFRIALQHNMHIRLMAAVESANCEEDDGELLSIENENQYIDEEEPGTSFSQHFGGNHVQSDYESERVKCVVQTPTSITLEEGVNVYVAGYLCFRLFKKFDCERCKKDFLKIDDIIEARELYLFYKNYGIPTSNVAYLTRTNKGFSDLVTCLLNKFNSTFETFKLEYGIKTKIRSSLVSYIENEYDNWFEVCKIHKMFILEILVKIKLYRLLKWEIEASISQKANKSGKPHRKVRILSSQ